MIEFLKKKKELILIIVISLLIELFICNFGAIRTLLITKEQKANFSVEDKVISIENINQRVTSININYKNKLTDKITYFTTFKSVENSAEFKIRDKSILKDAKHYINFDTHAECKSIRIELLTFTDIDIDSIDINKPCFNFNIYRIILIFAILLLSRRIFTKEIYEAKYDKNSIYQDRLFLSIMAIVFVLVCDYTLIQFGPEKLFIKYDEVANDDALLLQAETFTNGKAELAIEPSKELLDMEDPYDSDKRDTDGVPFAYDMTFYNGKYYSYFGVAPIITLILPFRLITGGYTYCYIFNLVYILGIMISLYVLYKKLIEKYVGQISLFNFYLGYYAILFGSNVLTLLRGMKYDITVSSGIMFILISLNLVIDIGKDSKFKILKLIILGITTGLIVLSKPNFIVYYLLIVFFGLISLKDIEKKEKIKDIVIFAIPLGLLGILQMIYNYIRFDSIFEFGARYQLTGFNMNYCTIFTIGKSIAGVIEYLFKMPEIKVFYFPFVFINNSSEIFRVNELLYENKLYGLFAIPILWILLFKKQILKENKNLNLIINLVITISVISMILNATFGGVCEVYAIDFKVMLCIFAVIILLKLTEDSNNKKEMPNKIMLILCALTILLMIPISFTTEHNFLTNFTSDFTIYLKNLFEIWN